jgi:hypothetical protein
MTRQPQGTAQRQVPRTAELLTVYDAAPLIGMAWKTLYQHSRRGLVESVRVGRLLYFTRAGLDRYLASRTIPMRDPARPRPPAPRQRAAGRSR